LLTLFYFIFIQPNNFSLEYKIINSIPKKPTKRIELFTNLSLYFI
jgi:hypothetical protein